MSNADGTFWQKSEKIAYNGRLQGDIETEVAIVGGGMTGLTTALQLSRAGIPSVVLEKFEVGSGTTGQSSAHLSNLWDGDYSTVIDKFGLDVAIELYRSMNKGISFIQAHASNLAEFERLPGYYFLSRDTEGRDALEKERQALNKMKVPHRCMKDPLFNQIALKIDRQGAFDPVAYLRDLASLYLQNGGKIFTHSSVDNFEGTTLVTATGQVKAKKIVWATHTPLGLNPILQSVVSPVRSFITIYRVKKPIPKALFWDTADPYRYIRPYKSDMVIIGGEDVPTGEPHEDRESYEDLENYLAAVGLEGEVASWSAQFFDPIDHFPIIGPDPMHADHYVATGLSGDGLPLGSFAGQGIAGLIIGDKAWQERLHAFRPLRLKTFFSSDFYSHNMRVARHMLGDRLRSTGLGLDVNLQRGEGAVVDSGGEKLAVYKDATGELKTYSAICPHMKAVVQWNEEDKTFDCPCHGSRFSCHGEVLEGPSLKPLKPIDNAVPPLNPINEPLVVADMV